MAYNDEGHSDKPKQKAPASSSGGKDSSGHVHVSSGPKGGQFTKSASGGSKPKPNGSKGAPASKGVVPSPVSTRQPALGPGGGADPARVKSLQQMLKDLKLSGSPVDGTYNDQTVAAVKAIQQKLGLKPTGKASSSLLRRLADAHALSPCVSKGVSASAAVYVPREVGEDDPSLVDSVVGAAGMPLSLWSDSTVWLGDALELDLDDARAVATSLRDRTPGPVGDWLTLHSDGEGVSLLTADGDGLELSDEDIDHFTAQLEGLLGTPVLAAAGHDTMPGHDELHHFWVSGEGRERWIHSPTPWTTLVALLTPHVGPEKAKIFASRWFIETHGYASGSDKNRVAHGHPPRGSKIGPG